MPDMVVSTSFKAQDRVTKSFGRMSKGADKFGRRASKAFQKASRSGRDFQSVTKGILAAGAVQRGLGLLEQGIGSVVRQFIDFDQAVTGAAVRFKDIGPDAVNFAGQLKLIKDRARLAGAETEFTAAQAAGALDFLARAGFKSAEAMGSLNSMIALSTATGEDFATVADFSSDLLGAFGLAVDDTGQKIKNLNRLNDVLVKTANSANVTVEDMFETMKVGAPIAVKYGASLEDVAAMTALMGNMGIKGSLGATAIKNIFTRLAAPTKEVTKSLAKLGLSQQDLIDKNGRFKNISDTMALIGDRIKDLPQAQQLGVLSGIFGARALAGGSNIVEAISKVKEFTQILKESRGTAEKTADILRKTLLNKLKALGSAATEAGFKFLTAFDKNGRDAITRLTEAVRQFDMTPVIQSAEKILNVFKVMLPILISSGPALVDMAAGMALYFGAMKVVALWGFVSALGAAGGAMAILNGIIMANPLGAFIAMLVGAKIAADWMIAHPEKVRAAFESAFDFISKLAQKTFNFIAFGAAKGLLNVGFIVKDFFGLDTSEIDKKMAELNKLKQAAGAQAETGDISRLRMTGTIIPPNRSEVEARQNINLSGNIQLAGAPPGSTGQLKSSHGSVNLEMLGENP